MSVHPKLNRMGKDKLWAISLGRQDITANPKAETEDNILGIIATF